jgi:hypothetical protein
MVTRDEFWNTVLFVVGMYGLILLVKRGERLRLGQNKG